MNYINPNAPAAGLTRLLNMRDNNPATQLAYVPTRDIAAMGSMGGLEFNPYSGIPQARGIAAVADGGSIQDAPLAPVADELASRGRYGDSMLLHVRPDELQGLASLGTLTINPDTGLPEAFNFKSLLPAVGAIAGSILLPGIGTSLGLSAGLSVGLGAGLGSFAGGLAAGQGVGQAALGGLMSGATAGLMQGLAPGLEAAAPGTDIAGQTASSAAELAAEGVTNIGTPLTTVPLESTASGLGISPLVGSTPAAEQLAISEGMGTSILSPELLDADTFAQALTQTPSSSIPGETLANVYAPNAPITPEVALPAEFGPSVNTTTGLQDTFVAPKAVERGSFSKLLGAEDIAKNQRFTRPEALAKGYIPSDITVPERARQVLTDPKTYIGAGINTLMQPPPEMEYQEPEPLTFSSYTPRERTLAGGVQSPARSSEEYLRMALEGGYQPLSEQYRYAAQGGLVGLEEGGQPSSLTAMSITPESERIRTDMSAAPSQEDRASRVFNDLESRGGVSALMSLVLRNNPQAIQFINQNASSPRNLQLNEMGAGRHSYFDTADTGLYPKAAGGLVRLVEGGTPEQGVLQSQLSPVLQQQQTPLLQQQEQQISERARQDELLQRDQAISRGQQFIEQPTGNQQLFQQMQNVGQVIGQQLAQGPESYATPPGQSAAPSSFVSGTSFGFNTGGLVGLREGGDIPQEESIEPYVSFLKEKEKFKAKPYIPTKGDKPTIGYGHTENVKMTDKEITEEQADLLLRSDIRKRLPKIKNKIKDFNSFPQSLKTAMVGEWFRGSLSGSPETIKLINAGEYEKASKEFLNNEEYRKAEERKRSGIKPRMELVSNELKKLSILEDKPFSSVYSGMPDVQKETQMAKLSDTENDAGILSILRNILSGEDKQYEVQAGDTLSAIAKQQGMSLDELLEANKSISDPNVISRGQEITVPDQSSFLDRVRGALGYAHGGEVGKYFEGQVVGNGDGMSDQILFEVEGNNPDKALLSRDEYVIPADVVAMLGNGSSNAGSEQLDGFIKNIRQDAFGTQQQQKQLNAQQGLRGLV